MGSMCATFKANEDIPGQGKKALEVAAALSYGSHEINNLYRNFVYMDQDKSGQVDVDEFIVCNKITCDLFGSMVFRLLDNDRSNELDFAEYMLATWNFCSLDKDSLAAFTFQIFDTDGSGFLDLEEVDSMISVLWGFNRTEQVERTLKRLDPNHDGLIALLEFVEKSTEFPILLFPAFEMQDKLRGRLLGSAKWDEIAEIRAKKYGRRTIFQIMDDMGFEGEYLDTSVDIILNAKNVDPTFKAKMAQAITRRHDMVLNMGCPVTKSNDFVKKALMQAPVHMATGAAGSKKKSKPTNNHQKSGSSHNSHNSQQDKSTARSQDSHSDKSSHKKGAKQQKVVPKG